MKVNLKYALMVLAAVSVGLTSCSNENDGPSIPRDGEKAVLNVGIAAPVMTKAVDATAAPTDVVENFTAFIIDDRLGSGGDINTAWTEYSSDGSNLTSLSVTTNAKEVYVVANAGDLSAITALSALKAKIADLSGDGAQATATNRWATGSETLSFTSGTASATVNVKFIAARITVKVNNEMTNYGNSGSLSLDGIGLMNVRGQSLLFPNASDRLIPASYTAGHKFYTGIENPGSPNSFANFPASADYTLNTTLFAESLTSTASDVYYYYVFENDATTKNEFPTIIALTGKAADGTTDIYWPVHLSGDEVWKAGSHLFDNGIERGNSYDITITLTGDAVKDGGSTTDPTDPVETTKVGVSVALTQWNLVPLGKEF